VVLIVESGPMTGREKEFTEAEVALMIRYWLVATRDLR
jgi:hypothetical protein